MEPRVWVLIVFVAAFALILSEKVHRTIAAWFGCVCMLFLGIAMSVFHKCETVASDAGGHGIFAKFGGGGTVEICHSTLEGLMLHWIHGFLGFNYMDFVTSQHPDACQIGFS